MSRNFSLPDLFAGIPKLKRVNDWIGGCNVQFTLSDRVMLAKLVSFLSDIGHPLHVHLDPSGKGFSYSLFVSLKQVAWFVPKMKKWLRENVPVAEAEAECNPFHGTDLMKLDEVENRLNE